MKLLIIPFIVLLGCGKPSKPSSLSGDGVVTILSDTSVTATIDTIEVDTLNTLDNGDIERSKGK